MHIQEITKDLYYVGVVDHSLKVFDVAILTEYGTSYNSYLLRTKEGFVLFEGSKEAFGGEQIAHIEEVCPLEEIRYLFVTHTEPDHSGAIHMLLERNPALTVVASGPALMNLQKILRKPFEKVQMTPGKDMEIGGYTFSFVPGTNLHWPDVMFTYIHELKALVSCDAFGAHFASDAIFLSKEPDKEGYYKALRYYFENIMGPFPSFVIKACDLVEKLDISLILPGHGCIIDENPMEQVRLYRRLAEEGLPVNDPNVVTICAASAYGYTKEIAERTAAFLKEHGKEVRLHIIDALNYNEEKPLVLKDILRSGTFLLGSPTLAGDAIVLFYDILNGLPWTKAQGKTASAFGDYGWSGEAVPNLTERMKQLKCKVLTGFRANFKMDEAQEEEFSRWLASLLG